MLSAVLCRQQLGSVFAAVGEDLSQQSDGFGPHSGQYLSKIRLKLRENMIDASAREGGPDQQAEGADTQQDAQLQKDKDVPSEGRTALSVQQKRLLVVL